MLRKTTYSVGILFDDVTAFENASKFLQFRFIQQFPVQRDRERTGTQTLFYMMVAQVR